MNVRNISKLICIVAVFVGEAVGSPKIGARKYSMDQAKSSDTVLIVGTSDSVNGSFMRDPELNHKSDTTKHGKKNVKVAPEPKIVTPRVPESEKSFKAMAIVGTLHNPRVGFSREYIELDQLEEIDQPAFSDELVQQLKKFEN